MPLEVRSTKHGPIISGLTPDFTSIAAQPIVGEGVGAKESPTTPGTIADSLSGEYAVSLSWTALDAGSTGEAIFALNLGKNFDDFRAAAALFDVPAQNLIYADPRATSGIRHPAASRYAARVTVGCRNRDGTAPTTGRAMCRSRINRCCTTPIRATS